MYTCEGLYAVNGDSIGTERLEKVAFNTMQVIFADDMGAHLLPVGVDTQVGSVPVSIRVERTYPFRMRADIMVDVREKNMLKGWYVYPAGPGMCGGEKPNLTFSDAPYFISRFPGLKTIEYGPLVFSLPIAPQYCMREYTCNSVECKSTYCDYELIPNSAWNCGFAASALTVEACSVDGVPFSSEHPPVSIHVRLAPVEWDWEDGFDMVPAVKPAKRVPAGSAQERELISLWLCEALHDRDASAEQEGNACPSKR